MTESEKQSIMLEIANLNQRYAQAADAADGEAYSRCFTETGVFDRFGAELKGRHALAELQKPNPDVKRRHFASNALVEFGEDGQVRGRGYLMVVAYDVPAAEQKPPTMVDFSDIYEKTPDGWLIARRAVSRAF
jgi:hypothetical protein